MDDAIGASADHQALFPDALPAGTVLGDYEIVRPIGQGGFGITYEGVHRFLGRRVAIKEFFVKQACRRQSDGSVTLTSLAARDGLTREDYARLLARFEREARKVSAKFDHPGIVQGEAYFVANGVGYFVMRFVSGVTLDHWLRRLGRPPDEAELAAVLRPVLLAVDYLHESDELHRDLTPKNIMLRPDGSPVIIDFGASREGLDRSSQTSMALATDGYAPPEQSLALDDAQQGRYTDIYALGAILYRAVTGRAPLAATDRTNAIARKRAGTDPYIPLGQAAPQPLLYSDRFFAAVDHALRLDEDDRPQSITEFLDELGWSAAVVEAPAAQAPQAPLPEPPTERIFPAIGDLTLGTSAARQAPLKPGTEPATGPSTAAKHEHAAPPRLKLPLGRRLLFGLPVALGFLVTLAAAALLISTLPVADADIRFTLASSLAALAGLVAAHGLALLLSRRAGLTLAPFLLSAGHFLPVLGLAVAADMTIAKIADDPIVGADEFSAVIVPTALALCLFPVPLRGHADGWKQHSSWALAVAGLVSMISILAIVAVTVATIFWTSGAILVIVAVVLATAPIAWLGARLLLPAEGTSKTVLAVACGTSVPAILGLILLFGESPLLARATNLTVDMGPFGRFQPGVVMIILMAALLVIGALALIARVLARRG